MKQVFIGICIVVLSSIGFAQTKNQMTTSVETYADWVSVCRAGEKFIYGVD